MHSTACKGTASCAAYSCPPTTPEVQNGQEQPAKTQLIVTVFTLGRLRLGAWLRLSSCKTITQTYLKLPSNNGFHWTNPFHAPQ